MERPHNDLAPTMRDPLRNAALLAGVLLLLAGTSRAGEALLRYVDPDGSLLLDVWGPIDRSAPETRELIRLEPGLDAATTVWWSREDGPER